VSIDISMNLTDNSKLVREALDEQIEQALIAVGMTAESYAKLPEKSGGHMPVDTGRLKNSITYAIAGQSPHITSYRADKGDEGGSYGGSMPQDPGGKTRSVYIGSNVEYAAAVENGISGKQTGKHFLRSALSDHTAEYKEFIEKALKGQ
jgi:hypothetical protein